MSMKLTAVMMLVLLGFAVRPSVAQMAVGGGVKGGVNLADISIDPDEEDCCDMKTGGVVGAFLNVGSEMVSFQPEFLYSMKGAKGTDDSKIKINVVEIPLLLRANMMPGTVRPFVVVGPAFSFKTSAKFEDPDGTEEDFSDEVRSTDIGAIFGAGIQAGPAIIEARYDLGLRDLDTDDSSSAKTRTFSILFGVSFGR